MTRTRVVCRDLLATGLEGRLAEGVTMPEWQPQQIELTSMPATAADPQEPASQAALRFVQFVDCRGDLPLSLVALECVGDTSVAAMKQLLLDPVTGVPGLVRAPCDRVCAYTVCTWAAVCKCTCT